jgi:hypothetical protein
MHMSNNPGAIVAGVLMFAGLIIGLWLFFYTEVGLTLKSTGDNPDMSRAQGVNVKFNKVLGLAIANAVNLLNPELVILHGFLLELGDWFLVELEHSIRENTLIIASNFSLRISDKMEELLPLGAVAEIFSDYLRSDDYKWVYQLRKQEA